MRRSSAVAVALIAMAINSIAAEGSRAAVVSPGASLESRFAVLRHAPVSQVPAAVSRFARVVGQQGTVVDAAQARRVKGPGGGWVDVVPGPDGICLYDEDQHVGTCAANADVLAGRLSVQLVQPSSAAPGDIPTDTPRIQIGLLPDGALSATATSRTGDATAATPTRDGLYQLTSSGPIRAVAMRVAGRPPVRLTGMKHSFLRRQKTPPVARASEVCGYTNCYWDGIPAAHYWTGWTFYVGQNQHGNWATVRDVTLGVYNFAPEILCGNAENLNGSMAGYWFCTAPGGHAYHDYSGVVRRGLAGAGYPSTVVNGYAGEFYTSLAGQG